jgi:hypothetical protein
MKEIMRLEDEIKNKILIYVVNLVGRRERVSSRINFFKASRSSLIQRTWTCASIVTSNHQA